MDVQTLTLLGTKLLLNRLSDAFYKLVILIIFKKERVQENFFGKSLGKSYDTRRMFFWYLPPYVTYAKIFAQVDDHIW